MVSPRPDDVVLGGQFTTPLDAAVLGGLQGLKFNFPTADVETKKVLLNRLLNYGEAVIARPQIEALKHWAAEAGARTASQNSQLLNELRQYSQQVGLGPLEVD